MGWPRTNKPRTSASTGGQNTGVDGARHAVADKGPAARNGPARSEPVLNQEVAPVNEEIASPEPSAKVVPGSVVGDDAARQAGQEGEDTGYDETSGIVYEVQPRGFEIIGLSGAADTDPGSGPPSDETGQVPDATENAVEQDPVREASSAPRPAPHNTGPRPVWNASLLSESRPASGRRESRDNPFGRMLARKDSGAAPDDGETPMTRFRDLPLDEKMRIWRLRALIVVIVGLVFTVVASWQVGITLAIIAGIVDTVYRSRSVESHAWTRAGTVDRATLRAQKRTQRQLAGMERAGYVALHKRPIPDSVEVIDHLVIGPTGVYAIDSEKWDKELPIRQSNGKKLWLGPESKTERLEHAHWEAKQASERLTAKIGMEVTVQPALAIYGPKISWVVLPVRGVDVFSGDHLKGYLRRRARRKDVTPLTREQIQKIYEAASDVLPVEWRGEVTPVG